MDETILQYYYKPNLFGKQVLWVKKRVYGRRQVALGFYRAMNYTIHREATASEAAAILPVLNAGLSDAS